MENFRKLKRRIIFSALFIISFLWLADIAEAAKFKLRVNVAKASIRLKPTIESMVISQAPLGAILESEGKIKEWYRVNLPQDESGVVVSGYIHENMVEALEEIKEIPEEVKPRKVEKIPEVKEEKIEEILIKTEKRGLIAKGVKIGVNLANVTGDDIEINWENKMGFCGGGFLTFCLSSMFAIQPEAFLTMKGYKSEQEGDFYTSSVTYLEIPVLAKVFVLTGGNIKPNIFAGPSLGIKISGAEYKSTDFGLVFGGGIDFALGTGTFLVECRYSMSLSSVSIFEKGSMTESESEDVKNRVISFMIGYYF